MQLNSHSESVLIAMAQNSIDRHAVHDEANATSRASFNTELEEMIRLALTSHSRAASIADESDGGENYAVDGPFPENVRLGKYKLIRSLGHGGFGIVLLGFDPKLKRHVAIKLPRPDQLEQKTWRKKFLHEARAAAALDHPGIVKLHEIGRYGPILYFASSYCEGPNLAQWLRQHGAASPRISAELVVRITDAVQHAHNRGILHRDLKPANILLRLPKNGEADTVPSPLVTDFGLASRCDVSNSLPTGLTGTLPYIAPEQLGGGGRPVSTATDIYSLGAILFELLVGRPLYKANDEKQLIEMIASSALPDLKQLRPELPKDLIAICSRCLAKEPDERYESAAALGRDLRRFLAGECVEARPAGACTRYWRWCRRRPLVAALAAALVMALVCGISIAGFHWQRAERHLHQTRRAAVDLGWAIDDAMFWQLEVGQAGSPHTNELGRRYAQLLDELGGAAASPEVEATRDCYLARLAELDQRFDSARQHYESSIRSWSEVVRRVPIDSHSRHALARTLYCYGLFGMSINQRPELYFIEDGKIFGEFDVHSAPDAAVIDEYARLLFAKAEALRDKSRREAAGQHYDASVSLYDALSAAVPENPDYRFHRCQAEVRRISVQRQSRSGASPYELRTEVLGELRELVLRYPEHHEYRMELAAVAQWMAVNSRRYNQAEQCEQLLEEAITALEPLVVSESTSDLFRERQAKLYLRLALLQANEHKMPDACQSAEKSLHLYDLAYRERRQNVLPLAQAYRSVAGIYRDSHRSADAVRSYERSVEYYKVACGDTSRSHRIHSQYASCWSNLAELYALDGRRSDAIIAHEQAISVLENWRGAEPKEPRIAEELRRSKSALADLRVEQQSKR